MHTLPKKKCRHNIWLGTLVLLVFLGYDLAIVIYDYLYETHLIRGCWIKIYVGYVGPRDMDLKGPIRSCSG